jgi:serine/threonine protein kinase
VKYENIMFSSPTASSVKIIDFGLSKKYAKDTDVMNDTVGTVYTMAPEVIRGEYDEACDVWSIGVLAFMLLSSSLPFYGKTRSHVVRKILHNKYGFKGKRWTNVSTEAMDFVKSVLVSDVKLRPTAVQAMGDGWFLKEFGNPENGPSIISSSVMDRVQATIQTFAGYSRLKKLALYVIAFKSTDEEIGFLRRLFLRRFDFKKDSPDISYPEFKEALKVYSYSDEELVHMFTAIDIDGTGKISYTEFLAATIEAHGSIQEERIAEAFDRLDGDDTGYITAQNLKDFFGDDIADDFIEEIIDEVDDNHDRRISYDEFLGLWDEDFDDRLLENLKDVAGKRQTRETFRGLPAEVIAEVLEDISFDTTEDTSSHSYDSNEAGPGNRFFAKEKEKSLRGVWI